MSRMSPPLADCVFVGWGGDNRWLADYMGGGMPGAGCTQSTQSPGVVAG